MTLTQKLLVHRLVQVFQRVMHLVSIDVLVFFGNALIFLITFALKITKFSYNVHTNEKIKVRKYQVIKLCKMRFMRI